MLSPREVPQTKLIEYMLDNNDFSNYKSRREVIKGERISRTLSKSGSKGRLHTHYSIPGISSYHNAS